MSKNTHTKLFKLQFSGASGNDVSHLVNGLTMPFATLVSAKWQQFDNIKLFKKLRAN